MSLTPAMVDALLAVGGTAEQLAALVKADMADKEAAREAKRANNAERQRRYRERHNADNALRDVTACDSVTDPALSRPPNENNLTPPPIPTREIKTTRARACRLPADWQPEAISGDLGASVAAWPPGAIERELARFRDWAASASGPNAVKLNWQSAWRNWLRKVEDDGRYGKRQRNGFSGQGTTRDLGAEVAAEFARTRGGGAADDLPRIGPPGRLYG